MCAVHLLSLVYAKSGPVHPETTFCVTMKERVTRSTNERCVENADVDLAGLGQALLGCRSNLLPGDADTAGQPTTH